MRQPKAFGYCRLSKGDVTHECDNCNNVWTLKVEDVKQTLFDCPTCGKEHKVDAVPRSIQTQADAIMDIANKKLPREVDANIEFFAEVVSGDVPFRDRNQGGLLLNKIKDGDYLIIAKLDRGFRNLSDFCNQLDFFERVGIKLILCDFPDFDLTTIVGRMVVRMMAVFAQFEREKISERTKEGLARRRKEGKPSNGHIPRGFQQECENCGHCYNKNTKVTRGIACPECKASRAKHTRLIPDPYEQSLMWNLLYWRSPYCWKDWDMIAHHLNEEGHRTRTGKAIQVGYARRYWYDAVALFVNGKLELRFRPDKMQNFRLGHIENLPKSVREKLDKAEQELQESGI